MYQYRMPSHLIERDGPFVEFKQDGAIVSVDLANGVTHDEVLLVYPDYIAAVPKGEDLPFLPEDVVRVFQSPENLVARANSSWSYFHENT